MKTFSIAATVLVFCIGTTNQGRSGEPSAIQLNEAISAFREIGGRYSSEVDPSTNKNIHCFELQPPTVDGDLKRLPNPPFAFMLSLDSSRITDVGLQHLTHLSNLRRLGLRGTRVTNHGMQILSAMQHLDFLDIKQTRVSDAGLAHLISSGIIELCLDDPHMTSSAWNQLGQCDDIRYLGLGGAAITDDLLRGLESVPKLTGLGLENTSLTSAGLSHVRLLGGLKSLNVQNNAGLSAKSLDEIVSIETVTDLILSGPILNGSTKALRNARHLTTLCLIGDNVTDATMEDLKELDQLKSLELIGTSVTDVGLSRISEGMSLRALSMYATRITDQGIKKLRLLKHLELLKVGGPVITGAGLAHLSQFPELSRCDVSASCIDNEGLRYLARVAQLTYLDVSATHIDDDGISHLHALKQLAFLDVSETKIGDTGLSHIAAIASLRELRIRDTKVTASAIAEFRRKSPDCVVVE